MLKEESAVLWPTRIWTVILNINVAILPTMQNKFSEHTNQSIYI